MKNNGLSRIVIFNGTKGREIFDKIAKTKPEPINSQKRAAEIREKLEKQGVKF